MAPLRFTKANLELLQQAKQEAGYTYDSLKAWTGVPADRLYLFMTGKKTFLTAEELKRLLDILSLKPDQVLEQSELERYEKEIKRAYEWHKQTFAPQEI